MANPYKSGRPSKQAPPEKAGHYQWRDKKTGTIAYVGETGNLQQRKQQHEQSNMPVSSKTHDFEWKQADGRFSVDSRREHEKKKIETFNPPLNERAGGGGRK